MPPTTLLRRDDETLSPTGTAVLILGLLSALAILAILFFHNKLHPRLHWHLHKLHPPSPQPNPDTNDNNNSNNLPSTPSPDAPMSPPPCLCHQIQHTQHPQYVQADFLVCGFRRPKPKPNTKTNTEAKKDTPSKAGASPVDESRRGRRSKRRRSRAGRRCSAAAAVTTNETAAPVVQEEEIEAADGSWDAVPEGEPEAEVEAEPEQTLARERSRDQVAVNRDEGEEEGYQTAEEEPGVRNRRGRRD